MKNRMQTAWSNNKNTVGILRTFCHYQAATVESINTIELGAVNHFKNNYSPMSQFVVRKLSQLLAMSQLFPPYYRIQLSWNGERSDKYANNNVLAAIISMLVYVKDLLV